MTPPSPWIAVFAGGLVTGSAVVLLLVVVRAREFFALLLGLAGIATATWGVLGIVELYQQPGPTFAAVSLSVAALGGGYALASSLLNTFTSRPHAVVLQDITSMPDSRPSVLVLACIEPERYRPSAVTMELERLSAADVPEATLGITPFLYAAQKARYRAIGDVSPSQAQAQRVTERLEELLGDTVTEIRLVSCDAAGALESAVAASVAAGSSSVVVAVISVGESYIVDRARERVDRMRPSRHGAEVVYTPPLWCSDRLTAHLADRIMLTAEHPGQTGVALVLQGQPDAWARSHAAFDVQENSFANRVRMLLVDRGVPPQNVRLCYAEWRDPDVTETVRHLAATGCARVLVSPVSTPFESTSTLLDLQMAVRHARVDEHVAAVTLGAWGDDPVIAEVLRDAIVSTMQDLISKE